jgi:RNA polymerase sigma factor (sigma-70 family)
MLRPFQSNVIAPCADAPLLLLQFPVMPTPKSGFGKFWMAKVAAGIQAADDARRSRQMAAAQAGDRAAYEALLRDCVPLIRRFAARQGVPADRLEDVVQDVLLTVHRARATYDPARSFTAWLRTIAERRAIDVLRRLGRQRRREVHAPLAVETHVDDGADPSRASDAAANQKRVDEALATLPESQREAVRVLLLEERSLDEAAGITRRSKGALKVNLHRALRALRIRFGNRDGGNHDFQPS